MRGDGAPSSTHPSGRGAGSRASRAPARASTATNGRSRDGTTMEAEPPASNDMGPFIGTNGHRLKADPGSETVAQPARWGANRRSRKLFITTNTLEPAMAAPATTGLSRPAAASGMAATL